ncbi:allophanate hydrolase subunit 1 [Microcella alkalica]|uniref:Urea carboxylase n=1 Tax=Microcella alkalica TaxID=355930 RepID=A0A839E6C8_9MICO|nr:carboxyltransferase domain-containing protein [Microcella alkalica]MBA8847350.1 urea carboxylase [Microcella alkalica]
MTKPTYIPFPADARLSFGGDEFIFIELSEDMRIAQALAIQSLAKTLTNLRVPGVIDICPAHASYMIRFDPDVLDLDSFLSQLREEHERAVSADLTTLSTRIVDVPVLYDDPWTRETLLKFRDRHQDPNSTDIEYVARVNGFASIDELAAAHSAHPFIVTFPNFVPGNAESVQLVPRDMQIQAPKYKRPRTETPSRSIGHGGAFTNVYPSFGGGGVQLLGRTPIDIVDLSQTRPGFEDRPVLFTAGTLLAFRAIDLDEYFDIRSSMEADTYRFRQAELEFSIDRHTSDWRGYNVELKEALP